MYFNQFFDIAVKQALKSPLKNKYGALLIRNNKIVSMGYNTYHGTWGSSKQYVLCG